MEKLDTLSGAFFSRLVSSETLVIKVPDLELFLKKVAVDDLKGIIIDRESTRFKLPENFAISEEGNINLKARDIFQIYIFNVLVKAFRNRWNEILGQPPLMIMLQ